MSKVTVREASVLTGVSRQTINDATKNGLLSFTKNKRGHKVIDISELTREFEIVENIDVLSNKKKESKSDSKVTVKSAIIDKEILSIKEELISAHERERSLWQDQVNLLKDRVEEIRKDKETYVRLIEFQGNGKKQNEEELNALKDANKSLSEQVQKLLDKDEAREQERMESRRIAQETFKAKKEKERIEKEESRGFFSKLFG